MKAAATTPDSRSTTRTYAKTVLPGVVGKGERAVGKYGGAA